MSPRRTVLLALVASLALAVPAGATHDTALPRTTVDRPDDVQGPQIHAIYAIPSDGTDRQLDTNGTIEQTVDSWNQWLASQSNGLGGFRLDTYQGSLDVTFFRDPHTDAQIAAQGAYVRDQLETDLLAAGVINAGNDKIYAVYYDGSSTYSCGGGAWPPALVGDVAAMYLHGAPPGAPPCDTNTFVPNGQPGYFEYGMIHEVMHTLGFVPTCAPHTTPTSPSHVDDATDDLMYAGAEPWQFPAVLDVNHDDYFEAHIPGCLDLASSPYFVGHPYVAPKPKPKPVPKCKKRQRSTRKKPCRH